MREEGILTLWRGCGPTIGRALQRFRTEVSVVIRGAGAVVLNIAQLMSNDLAKDALCRQDLVVITGLGLSLSTALCRQDVVARLKEKNTFLQVLVAGCERSACCTRALS